MDNNSVKLQGVVLEEPSLDEELLMGEKIYTFNLSVPRESGVEDILVLRISNRLSCFDCVHKNAVVEVNGDLRTYRIINGDKKRLRVVVFCNSVKLISDIDTSTNNVVEITGLVGKEPSLRKAKSSDRLLCEVQVRVQRQRNKVSIIPVIAWGRMATYAEGFKVGEEVSVSGRLQSRNLLRHNGDDFESDVTYEVSASGIKLCDA